MRRGRSVHLACVNFVDVKCFSLILEQILGIVSNVGRRFLLGAVNKDVVVAEVHDLSRPRQEHDLGFGNPSPLSIDCDVTDTSSKPSHATTILMTAKSLRRKMLYILSHYHKQPLQYQKLWTLLVAVDEGRGSRGYNVCG